MRREILTILSSEGLQRGSAGSYSPAPCRGTLKGVILSRERMAPFPAFPAPRRESHCCLQAARICKALLL
nr:MAG TPA: hypothetical protein [Caudoviricetes sp.]